MWGHSESLGETRARAHKRTHAANVTDQIFTVSMRVL